MIDIYLDSGSLEDIERYAADERVKGFTTNPSLMRKAGITDYQAFARRVLDAVPHKPVSFEVLADDLVGMTRQAIQIASWGDNVIVKVPVVTTKGEPTTAVLQALGPSVKVNLTAVFTYDQVEAYGSGPYIISIFAGRIADTGTDPTGLVRSAKSIVRCKVLWASTREVLNIYHAAAAGADIITLSPALLEKSTALFDKDLYQYSLETVQEFYRDAQGIVL